LAGLPGFLGQKSKLQIKMVSHHCHNFAPCSSGRGCDPTGKDRRMSSPPYNMNKSAGIFKQSMGARNRVGIGLSYRPARLLHIQPGGIVSLETILGLLESLKIRT